MMKLLFNRTIQTTTIASLAISIPLLLQNHVNAVPPTVALNGTQTTVLSGTSSGPVQSPTCAGFVSKEANHRVNLNRASNLNFTLAGNNDATLLIVGSNAQSFCVQADQVSQGRITIPGRWEVGQYDIFVGSRSGQTAPYQLTIGPMEI